MKFFFISLFLLSSVQAWAQETDEAGQPDAVDTPPVPAPEDETTEEATLESMQEMPSSGQAYESSAHVLTGTIRQSLDGAPVAGARVLIVEQGIAATTGEDGSFVLRGVAGSKVRLRVRAEGFAEQDQVVNTSAGAIAIAIDPDSLEEIVITGRAGGVARKNLANAVTTIRGEALAAVSSQTLAQALQGKVAGANIQANSGAPGGGMQIRLRGVSTIKGRSEPLYIIDGVILSDNTVQPGLSEVTGSATGSSAARTQDNAVNRIADLNPYDIESIEILKGASAAAIYGSKASNGVVIIKTKKGMSGPPRVFVQQRFGTYMLANTIGARSYTREEALARPGKSATEEEAGQNFDHERQLAGRTDLSTETIARVTGGGENSNYYASVLVKNDKGIIKNTGYQKQSGFLKIGQTFGDRLELNFAGNLIHSLTQRGLTNNDNNEVSNYMVLTQTPSFIDLRRRADGSFPVNRFIESGANPLQTRALMQEAQDVYRAIGSVSATLDLIDTGSQTLRLLGVLGVDQYQQKDDFFFPPELHFEDKDGLPGTSLDTTSRSLNRNLGLNVLHKVDLGALAATTSAGLQLESRDLDTIRLVSRGLTAGQANVDAGTVTVGERKESVRDLGFYLQEEVLLLDETLHLSAAVRGERSSLNGDADRFFFYPKASVAYTMEDVIPGFGFLKLRAAYGETGNQPLYGQKYTALDVTQKLDGNPGIVSSQRLGHAAIVPERQREIEAGVDLSFLGGRALVELTFYQRQISDLLLDRTPAPSTGNRFEFENGGELRNRGFELAVQVTPFRSESYSWLSRIALSANRSEIASLPGEAFNTGGFGTGLGVFRIEEGKSATQIVGTGDSNRDGIIDDNDELVQLGDAEPDFRVGWYNSVEFGDFGMSFLVDWQKGSDVINLTQFLYDATGNSPDVEAAKKRSERFKAGDAGTYVQDASFVKLRELSVWWTLPRSIVDSLQIVYDARISVSARNLLTATSYQGLDPEVSNFGNQPIARNIDVAPFPPSRSLWLSFSAEF